MPKGRMMGNRQHELLAAFAEALKDGRSVDLAALNMNVAELGDITVLIGNIISGYMKSPRLVQSALLLTAANNGEIPLYDSVIWADVARAVASDELDKLLDKLGNEDGSIQR